MKNLHDPVAVRCFCFLPEAAFRDKAIGVILRRPKTFYTKSEYLAANLPGILLRMPASGKINFKRSSKKMKNNSQKKLLSLFLCVVLAAALALTGCGKAEEPAETTAPAAVETTAPAEETTAAAEETTAAAEETTAAAEETAAAAEATVLGEGQTAFTFVVTDVEGTETRYEIHTDKKTVGEALMDNELVSGTVGEWGLMVDTVNGIKLDYDKDGMYWAFYIDGEYAQTGVDATEIAADAVYSFVATKA